MVVIVHSSSPVPSLLPTPFLCVSPISFPFLLLSSSFFSTSSRPLLFHPISLHHPLLPSSSHSLSISPVPPTYTLSLRVSNILSLPSPLFLFLLHLITSAPFSSHFPPSYPPPFLLSFPFYFPSPPPSFVSRPCLLFPALPCVRRPPLAYTTPVTPLDKRWCGRDWIVFDFIWCCFSTFNPSRTTCFGDGSLLVFSILNDSCLRVRVDDNMCLYLGNVCSSGRAQHFELFVSIRFTDRCFDTDMVISDFARDSFDPDISESGEASFSSALIYYFIDGRCNGYFESGSDQSQDIKDWWLEHSVTDIRI